jgi:prepilin-type N-terminal cleavage/methylation domain-containing protein
MRTHTAPAPDARRGGFTLLEVMVALVILGFVIMGAQATITDRMVRGVGFQESRLRASQLALDRIHLIQADPAYATLAARYSGTESTIANAPRYTRTTLFRTSALTGGNSYLTVTVSVSSPRLPRPVSRTITVASP